LLLFSKRCLLHDLIKLTTFRQKDLIRELYHYVYPITVEKKSEYSIGNIKLPAAEDKIYETSMSLFFLFTLKNKIFY